MESWVLLEMDTSDIVFATFSNPTLTLLSSCSSDVTCTRNSSVSVNNQRGKRSEKRDVMSPSTQTEYFPPTLMILMIHTFPSPLEEKPHHKNLQSSHRNHHQPLNNTKVENPAFRATHGTEVAVLAGPEVLLVPRNGRQLRR